MGDKAKETEALFRLYQCLNGPNTHGPVWVRYSRPQVVAMLDVVKRMLVLRGYEFRSQEDVSHE